MPSEIEKRRKIDQILSPPIAKANKLAIELKTKSDGLKSILDATSAKLKLIKARQRKLAVRSAIAKKVASKPLLRVRPKF
jgi:hypothetical protein